MSKKSLEIENREKHSILRTLSKSMRGNMRSLSVHHLRNIQLEELAADMIHDIVEGGEDFIDSTNTHSTFQQHFKYLESKAEIKCLTRPMADKRKIMDLLENYESMQPTSNSLSQKSKVRWHSLWHKTSKDEQQLSLMFKNIEGKLGTGGSLFFRFISSVALLDIFVFCLSFLFLSLPQITNRLDFHIHQNLTNFSDRGNGVQFSGRELILGDGCLEDTVLYYGHYSHLVTTLYSRSYNSSLAYFLVTSSVFFCALIALCTMFSKAFKTSYYNTKGGVNHVDANLIFSAWDFNIKEEKMATLCSGNVFLDLKILSAELQRMKQVIGSSDKAKMVMIMIAVEVFIVVIMMASPISIYYACLKAGKYPRSLSFKLGIPILLTCFNSLLPKLFSELGKTEKFRSSRTRSYLIVVRSSFLQALNLGILVYYWFSHLACSTNDTTCVRIKCWETFVGTQLFTLTMLNLIKVVIITCIQLIKRWVCKVLSSKVNCKFMRSLMEAREFDVARTSTDIVYIQCLLWLSIYFSPLLSLLVIFELLLTLGLTKLMAKVGCYLPVKVWRLGYLDTLIKLIHLITFLFCLSVFIYTVVYVTPSSDCGPFKIYQHSYDMFMSSTDVSKNDSFKIIIRDVLSSVAFRAYVCIIFGIIVFYLRVHAQGRLGIADQLKRQIELESKDRCYYIEASKLLRGHLKITGEQVEATRNRRPAINHLVKGSQQQSSPIIISMDSSPFTRCIGPAYWPLESRHLVTCDQYNIMFPDRRASINPPGNDQEVMMMMMKPYPDSNPISDEVDRLFDFEKENAEGGRKS